MMDKETLWILKKLSAQEISAQSASRILRALELLQKVETRKNPASSQLSDKESFMAEKPEEEVKVEEFSEMKPGAVDESVEKTEDYNPDEEEHVAEENDLDAEDAEQLESEEDDNLETVSEEEPMLAELVISEKINVLDEDWVDVKSELMEDDGAYVMLGIPNGAELIIENLSGYLAIHGWDQPHIRIEAEEDSFIVLQSEHGVRFRIENDIALYVPNAISKINLTNGSGPVDIEGCSSSIFADSDSGDMNIKGADGSVEARSIGANIKLDGCNSAITLKSSSGDITVTNAVAIKTENSEGTGYILDTGMEEETENGTEVKIEADSGNIALLDVDGKIDVKGNGGDIQIERCRGKNIVVESRGSDMILKDVANDMILKGENGRIVVEDFFGKVKVYAKDSHVSLKKSGDAEIHIESDGGDIRIEDCYADAYVNSGTGHVYMAGGNLSFAGMGRVELNMREGDAYLSRRTFEDVRITIENGNAELDVEKLGTGGSGIIRVYKGDITLKVPPDFKGDLTARSSRRKIHLDVPMEIIEKDKNQIKGTMNGGGAKVDLNALNGEIKLQMI